MSEKFQEYLSENNGDRNAFLNHFKSPDEFSSLISNMFRDGELDLNYIKINKLKFVGKLIGRDKADRLSPGELDVFIIETEKVIESNRKLISGAKAHLEEEALRAGFVNQGGYDSNGEKVLTGDVEAYQDHINYGENPDSDAND